MTPKKYNFYAGPAILPPGVITKAGEAVLDFEGSGLSLLEISHRSTPFVAVMEKAEYYTRQLLGAGEEYAVMFLSGGASTQFFTVAMNLLDETEKAAYVDTGAWSSRAIEEAQRLARVEVIASSENENYSYIPKGWEVPGDCKYLHLTSNNTIYGTQYREFPEVEVPIVCDMSSDIFSRPVDIRRFGIIYAGAQKNMGTAGTTLVVLKKELLGRVQRTLPSMVDYRTHMDKGSMYNTPPVFPVYVSMLTLEWIVESGGLEVMEKLNREKADLLYSEIDHNPLFCGTARPEDRSQMNICFRLKDPDLEGEFLQLCGKEGIVGIRGHRSVGGFRASIYNAMDLQGVKVLAGVMNEFAKKFA